MPNSSGKVSAQRKVRAKHTKTKGPAQKWPVTDTAPGVRARGTGRASAAEAAPGPGDGTSQGGRGCCGPARAGLAIVAYMLRARVTGRAYAAIASRWRLRRSTHIGEGGALDAPRPSDSGPVGGADAAAPTESSKSDYQPTRSHPTVGLRTASLEDGSLSTPALAVGRIAAALALPVDSARPRIFARMPQRHPHPRIASMAYGQA